MFSLQPPAIHFFGAFPYFDSWTDRCYWHFDCKKSEEYTEMKSNRTVTTFRLSSSITMNCMSMFRCFQIHLIYIYTCKAHVSYRAPQKVAVFGSSSCYFGNATEEANADVVPIHLFGWWKMNESLDDSKILVCIYRNGPRWALKNLNAFSSFSVSNGIAHQIVEDRNIVLSASLWQVKGPWSKLLLCSALASENMRCCCTQRSIWWNGGVMQWVRYTAILCNFGVGHCCVHVCCRLRRHNASSVQTSVGQTFLRRDRRTWSGSCKNNCRGKCGNEISWYIHTYIYYNIYIV